MYFMFCCWQDIEELQKYISQSCGIHSGIHDDDDVNNNNNNNRQECTMALNDIPSVDLVAPTTEQHEPEIDKDADADTSKQKTTKVKVDLNKRMVIEIEGTNIRDTITIQTVSMADEDILKTPHPG